MKHTEHKSETIDGFQYDNESQLYKATIQNIDFMMDEYTDENAEYARKLASAYHLYLSKIMDFLLEDEAFRDDGIFPDQNKETLLPALGTPSILLLSNNDGQCSYCNQTLDDTHIISFEFSDIFDDLYDLTIEG
ncbi:hypothetical protein [Absiella sp. AM29-15]|uniref:hypothetical protein n=1 Tax=Absiella sp. AM29-15 TaxID=2292278 RepID=UPI000E421EF5|nr:hypothetical protein [Absiella sp. AM29-15]RGC52802.1 hypothetical protein DW761_03915 [Absiella sp. AM29-15]